MYNRKIQINIKAAKQGYIFSILSPPPKKIFWGKKKKKRKKGGKGGKREIKSIRGRMTKSDASGGKMIYLTPFYLGGKI